MSVRTFRRRAALAAATTAAALLAVVPATATAAPADPVQRLLLTPAANAATGVSIDFRTAADDAAVEYRTAGGPAKRVAARTKDGSHRVVRLTGLTPQTAYEYRVIAGGKTGPWHTVTTASKGYTSPFDLIYFGDAQVGLTKEWPVTAAAATSAVPDAQLILSGGDQIDSAHDDREWGDWYRGFGGAVKQTPLVTALGNHELSVDPLAQAYRNHVTNPGNGPDILQDTSYYVDNSGVRIVVLSANNLLLDQQAAFLDRALRTNPHRWSVVMFHQPVYNASTKRNEHEHERAFGPIIEKHDVDLVLNGHDHAYARGHKKSSAGPDGKVGPVYLVSSAGGKFYETGPRNPAWDDHGAKRVVWAQDMATYQKLTFGDCALDVTSVVTVEGDKPTSNQEVSGVGGVLDEFTVDKCGGRKVLR